MPPSACKTCMSLAAQCLPQEKKEGDEVRYSEPPVMLQVMQWDFGQQGIEVCFGFVHFVKKGSSAAIEPQQEKKDKKEKKARLCWQVSLVQKPHLTAGQERKGGGAH